VRELTVPIAPVGTAISASISPKTAGSQYASSAS
jgi:hypothetical protein